MIENSDSLPKSLDFCFLSLQLNPDQKGTASGGCPLISLKMFRCAKLPRSQSYRAPML
jgi:hypothetical protein